MTGCNAKTWSANNSAYFYGTEVYTNHSQLPVAVYKLAFSPKQGFYLSHIKDSFDLPKKIYDIDSTFQNLVLQTWNSSLEKDIGVLMSGFRGTGKTMTAKTLLNTVKLPVIVVDASFQGIANFLESISQDVAVLFDEFEKVFQAENRAEMATLLAMFDGVSSPQYRRFYILTVNETEIEPNLLDRPGRLLFHKAYASLPADVTLQIVDDLFNPSLSEEHKQDLIDTLGKIALLTIDTATKLINMVNLTGQKASELLPYLNISLRNSKYNVTITGFDSETEKSLSPVVYTNKTESNLSHDFFDPSEDLGSSFYVSGDYYGEVISVLDKNSAILDATNIYWGDKKRLGLWTNKQILEYQKLRSANQNAPSGSIEEQETKRKMEEMYEEKCFAKVELRQLSFSQFENRRSYYQ